ncbi:PaaI family thioesterase [Yoonia litorea]|uniref:Uncharacterized domain 1-containing protein n=1 Tax=Yoonia litorea TaxID=1123755 RepID=A0A1I6M5Q7_9RHOB|nr:PaaI family thioesterase [Yoonia litorea]SFS11019.1 uncharacterized domain 1-containing protein [Yoonia litorea]
MKLQMDVPALNHFLKEEFPQVRDSLLVEAILEDGLRVRLCVDDNHLRPGGTVSGPAMFMLADVAIYLSILARIGPQALTVTTSCAMDFLRKPLAGVDLLCEVRVLKIGKRLAICDALILSEGQAGAVARANMTYAIPPAQA